MLFLGQLCIEAESIHKITCLYSVCLIFNVCQFPKADKLLQIWCGMAEHSYLEYSSPESSSPDYFSHKINVTGILVANFIKRTFF